MINELLIPHFRLHIAQIRNPCLSQAVSLSAGQWKVLPSASGIPAWLKALLPKHCVAIGNDHSHPDVSGREQIHLCHNGVLLTSDCPCRKTDRARWHKDPAYKYRE